MAMPTLVATPWPSGPVVASTPDTKWYSGCPTGALLPIFFFFFFRQLGGKAVAPRVPFGVGARPLPDRSPRRCHQRRHRRLDMARQPLQSADFKSLATTSMRSAATLHDGRRRQKLTVACGRLSPLDNLCWIYDIGASSSHSPNSRTVVPRCSIPPRRVREARPARSSSSAESSARRRCVELDPGGRRRSEDSLDGFLGLLVDDNPWTTLGAPSASSCFSASQPTTDMSSRPVSQARPRRRGRSRGTASSASPRG